MLRRMQVFALGAVLVAASGCASSSPGSQTAPPNAPPNARRSTTVLSATELSSVNASTLYQAIQMLRPQWLRGRPSGSLRGNAREEAIVYVDNNRYGTINSLNQLSTGGVVEIRFYDASEATNRYGTGHGGGAIVISLTAR